MVELFVRRSKPNAAVAPQNMMRRKPGRRPSEDIAEGMASMPVPRILGKGSEPKGEEHAMMSTYVLAMLETEDTILAFLISSSSGSKSSSRMMSSSSSPRSVAEPVEGSGREDEEPGLRGGSAA